MATRAQGRSKPLSLCTSTGLVAGNMIGRSLTAVDALGVRWEALRTRVRPAGAAGGPVTVAGDAGR